MARIFSNVRLTETLACRLVPADRPETDEEQVWANFWLRGKSAVDLAPLKFKLPIGHPADTETLFRASLEFARGGKSSHGKGARDLIIVRFYPQDAVDSDWPERRMTVFDWLKNEDALFSPAEAFEVIRWDGKPARDGALVLFPEGSEPQVTYVPVSRTTIAKCPAVVRINRETCTVVECRYNGVKIITPSGVEIYDRRKNEHSPFGLVEEVEVNRPDRTFRFILVKDDAAIQPGHVLHVLTEDGLRKVR